MSNPPLCIDLSLEAHENISLASSERLDWRGDTAAMFLFSHQSFPPLLPPHLSPLPTITWQFTLKHCSVPYIHRAAESSGVRSWLLCNSAPEINDRCSEAVNQGLCVEWEFDRCTINSFTASWDKYTLLSIEEERCIETTHSKTEQQMQKIRCVAASLSCLHLSTSA